MSKTIWITGAAGFTARHLVQQLIKFDPDVRLVGLVRKPVQIMGYSRCLTVDLTDQDALRSAVLEEPPDEVYHLAGAVPPATEEILFYVNVYGTQLLFDAVSRSEKDQCRVLVASSAAVYRQASTPVDEGSPAGGSNPYGRSKWAQEKIALACGEELGIEVVLGRAFNLIGPGMPERLLAASVVAQCRSGNRSIETGDLSSYRDFVDVRDASAAYVAMMARGESGHCYNVCSSIPTCTRELVRKISELAGGLEIREVTRPDAGVDFSCGTNLKLQGLGWSSGRSLDHSLEDMMSNPPKTA